MQKGVYTSLADANLGEHADDDPGKLARVGVSFVGQGVSSLHLPASAL
jgi:hypothetical protein